MIVDLTDRVAVAIYREQCTRAGQRAWLETSSREADRRAEEASDDVTVYHGLSSDLLLEARELCNAADSCSGGRAVYKRKAAETLAEAVLPHVRITVDRGGPCPACGLGTCYYVDCPAELEEHPDAVAYCDRCDREWGEDGQEI